MTHLPNIIIIEGIDRVGKTTLVNKIATLYGHRIFVPLNKNLDSRTKEIETEKLLATLSLLKLLKHDKIIIDRFHLSELIYGIVDRNYVNDSFVFIDEELAKLNSLLIYVKPTDLDFSILQHGSNLVGHNILFETMYKMSAMNKVSCKYSEFDTIIESLESGCYK